MEQPEQSVALVAWLQGRQVPPIKVNPIHSEHPPEELKEVQSEHVPR